MCESPITFYRPQGKVIFSQACVILSTIGLMESRSLTASILSTICLMESRSLTARSVRILLECFLVLKYFLPDSIGNQMPLHSCLGLFKINLPSNDATMYSLCFQHGGEFRQNESGEEMLRPVVYRQLCEQPLRNQNISISMVFWHRAGRYK